MDALLDRKDLSQHGSCRGIRLGMCIRYSSPRIFWTLEKALSNNREGRIGRHSVIKWNSCGCNYEAKRHSPTCFGMQPNHGGCLLCCYTGYLGIFSSFLV